MRKEARPGVLPRLLKEILDTRFMVKRALVSTQREATGCCAFLSFLFGLFVRRKNSQVAAFRHAPFIHVLGDSVSLLRITSEANQSSCQTHALVISQPCSPTVGPHLMVLIHSLSSISSLTLTLVFSSAFVSPQKQTKDPWLRKSLDARQAGLKMIANVTYGYTAASFSGRMPCAEIADTIVQTGREILERAIRTIEDPETQVR